jgi:hypothetical protein
MYILVLCMYACMYVCIVVSVREYLPFQMAVCKNSTRDINSSRW